MKKKNQYAEDETEENGQPAHAGDGVVMHPAVILGDVHSTDTESQCPNHGRENQRHQGGGEQGGQGQPYGGKL